MGHRVTWVTWVTSISLIFLGNRVTLVTWVMCLNFCHVCFCGSQGHVSHVGHANLTKFFGSQGHVGHMGHVAVYAVTGLFMRVTGSRGSRQSH